MALRSSASSVTRGDRGSTPKVGRLSQRCQLSQRKRYSGSSRRNDFEYVLCLDVSRWERFQDIDLSAQFSAICKKNKKQVIYTTIGKPKENDPLYPVYVQFERFRAAQYSRELSDKVWRGCVKIAEQGYLAGGSPPFGLSRLLLDEKREPLQVLNPGQHKGIHNQRVTLVEGPPEQVAVIRRVFEEFVEHGYSEYKIAERLNSEGILSPGGRRWGAGSVLARLRNEKYAGTMVYNQTSGKLKTPKHDNPIEEWVRTIDAFDGFIKIDLFMRAQEILEKRKQRYDPDYMLRMLDALYKSHGMVRPGLLRLNSNMPSAGGYSREFGSLDQAFQKLFDGERVKARDAVHEQIRSHVPGTLTTNNFGQARRIIAARAKTSKKSVANRDYTVNQLQHDIAETTRVKTSFVREAMSKENRFMTLHSGVSTLFQDAKLVELLMKQKLDKRPALAGDFRFEPAAIPEVAS